MYELLFKNLSHVEKHIKEVIKNPDLSYTDELAKRIARQWDEKNHYFDKIIKGMFLEETDHYKKEQKYGALIMTYSGSIYKVGCSYNNYRKIEHFNFDVNMKNPEIIKYEKASLLSDIKNNTPIVFFKNVVKTTSPVFKICINNTEKDYSRHDELLRKVILVLSDSFAEINSTIK